MENLDQTAEHDNDTPSVDVTDELTKLKARADMMNIEYHPSIGVAKLREKINAHLNAEAAPVVKTAVALDKPAATETTDTKPAVETEGMRRQRLMNDAGKLVRVVVSCKNPAKKEWPGQLISAGNSLVGTFTKFVPFDNEEGWHVPHIIYKQLKAAEYQSFYTEKTKNGVSVRRGKLQKEFAVELLDPLTPEELHDLAQRQAMAKSID